MIKNDPPPPPDGVTGFDALFDALMLPPTGHDRANRRVMAG
jgi:hypothetical protein